jgi:hypothetical protein
MRISSALIRSGAFLLAVLTACGSARGAGGSPRTVPVEIPNLIFLQARVNGSAPLWFLLDSGSTFSFLDQGKAEELGLKTRGQESLTGGGENRFSVRFAEGVRLDIGGVRLSRQTLAVTPWTRRYDRPVVGIIGAPFFERFVAEIDYRAERLRLHEPKGYEYRGSGEVLPLEFQERIPAVRLPVAVATRAPVEAKLMVDTGAGTEGMLLNGPFVTANRLLDPGQGGLEVSQPAAFGGESPSVLARVRSVNLGRFVFQNLVTSFSRATTGFGSRADWDGVIGNALLRRFTMILDYSRKRLILEPNDLLDVPTDYDMTGMSLASREGEFRISRVFSGSRAAKAGLRAGDVLVSLDGRAVSHRTLAELCRSFRQDGSEHLLKIRRNGEEQEVNLQMIRIP